MEACERMREDFAEARVRRRRVGEEGWGEVGPTEEEEAMEWELWELMGEDMEGVGEPFGDG